MQTPETIVPRSSRSRSLQVAAVGYRRWPVVCALIICTLGLWHDASQAQWKAGASKIVITPPKPMWMAGYGSRDHAAEGKESDLFAKALVLEDATGNRILLVTLDLVGIDRDLSREVRQRLQQDLGLRIDQIALCVSHTHCGPVVARNLGPLHYWLVDNQQQELIEEYAKFLLDQVVAVSHAAAKVLAPAQLTWGNGHASYAVNRRANVEAKVLDVRAEKSLAGPFDHDVPVLAVRGEAGELRAVVFGYACHATVMSFYKWCGDHPGFAQEELEQTFPGAVAMFWAGCGADQNPLPRRTVELARHYGKRLAVAVEEVLLATKMTPVVSKLATAYREVALPLGKLPTREEIEAESQSTNKFNVARAKFLLSQLDTGVPLPSDYPYPVATWRIGDDIHFVILGGEVVVDYAVRLKQEFRQQRTWVAGYSNDVMAYIPSRRVLIEGGYEGAGAMVYYGLPTAWGDEVEEVIVAEVRAQFRALFEIN